MQYLQGSNFLVLLGALLASALVVAVSYYAIAYLKTAKEDKVFGQILTYAEVLVKSIEQQMKIEGYEKKQLVTLGLQKFALLVGAKLEDEQLDDIIEAAVFSMKQLAKLTPGEIDDEWIGKLAAGLTEGAG